MAKAKKVVKRAPKRVAINKLFPGLPDYVGPQTGWFGFIHHGELFEHSYEPIKNRVDYIRGHKPDKEIKTRLRHLIYLGEKLGETIEKCNVDEGRGNYSRYATGHSKMKTLVRAYVKRHIDPLCWNGSSLAHGNGKGRDFTG